MVFLLPLSRSLALPLVVGSGACNMVVVNHTAGGNGGAAAVFAWNSLALWL